MELVVRDLGRAWGKRPLVRELAMGDTRALSVRISSKRAADLEFVARADGVSVAEATRTAIDQHIEARRRDRAFQDRITKMMEEEHEVLKRLAE